VLASALLLLASSPLGRAQSAGDGQLAAYRTLVERYRSGDYAAAVDAVSAGPTQSAASVLTLWSSRAAPPWIDRLFVQAAALLHTDLAASFWRRGRNEDASSHIELARRFAEASAGASEASDIFRRRWYLGAALLHARHLAPGEAIAFFDRATRAAPNDVAILTAKAWLHERVALSPGLSRGASLARVEATRNRHLADASSLARAALAADPTATEASLRLGRIETLRGRLPEASGILEGVVARGTGSWQQQYIGRLLLGAVRERQGRRDDAAAVYQEAALLSPDGQSARVALALLHQESGDFGRAAEAMRPVVSPRTKRRLENDPWADYLLGPIPFGDLVLDALRVEVRRP
jgi:tetratricopeptide (TPR) repeat protein